MHYLTIDLKLKVIRPQIIYESDKWIYVHSTFQLTVIRYESDDAAVKANNIGCG
jgi:hypothetical protein